MGVDDEGPPLVIVATVQFSRTAEEATPAGFAGVGLSKLNSMRAAAALASEHRLVWVGGPGPVDVLADRAWLRKAEALAGAERRRGRFPCAFPIVPRRAP